MAGTGNHGMQESERLFSTGRQTVTERQNRINPKKIQILLFLND